MATKPVTLPNWNTGGANRIAPSGAKQILGWVAGGDIPTSGNMNWWMNLVYSWLAYVDDLAAQAFTWTGLHVFSLLLTASKGIVVTQGTTNGIGLSSTGNGTGHGVVGIGGSSANTYGVSGVASGTNNHGVRGAGIGSGSGVVGDAGATGSGLHGNGGTTSGTGVNGVALGGNSVGVNGQGHGTSAGVTGTGGATGAGAEFTGGTSGGKGAIISATGAETGAVITGGIAAGLGLRVIGQNGGFGGGDGVVVDVTGGGRGLSVLASSGGKSTLYLQPQLGGGASPQDGDIYYELSTNKLRLRAAGAWVNLN